MRTATLKILLLAALFVLVVPFSAVARVRIAEGRIPISGNNSSGFQDLRDQNFRANGTEDVDSTGRLINQVNDLRALNGGDHGAQDPFVQFGSDRALLENQTYPANFLSLAKDALEDGSTLHPAQFLSELQSRVQRLQSAARTKDEGGAAQASKDLWQFLKGNNLHHRFLDGSTSKVRIDDLGQALCVDGETATGRVQDFLEKGFRVANIPFLDQQENQVASYSPNSDPGNAAPSSVLTGSIGGLDTEGILERSAEVTDAEAVDAEDFSSAVRAPRAPSSLDEDAQSSSDGDFDASPSRSPRGSVPQDTPTNPAYGNCAPTPAFNNQNFNPNQNQNRNNNDNNKNAKNKNPGEKNPGEPKNPRPQDPFPQIGGAQGGGGGEPGQLQQVNIAKGGPASPFRGPNAEADPFNYLNAIREAGQFDSQYDYAKTIREIELNNLRQVQIRADFLAATPIVRYGGGAARGKSAAPSNRARLDQIANTGASTRNQPFEGLFGN